MRTVRQSLKDAVKYPLNSGVIEDVLMGRGLDGNAPVNAAVINSKEFLGAKADCLMECLTAVNFSESDISVSIPDPKMIIKQANWLYSSIGEAERSFDQPVVRIGPPPGAYVSY